MSNPVQLGIVLANNGYTIMDLIHEVQQEYAIDGRAVYKYARMLCRNTNTDLQKERWKYIDRALERMGVDW